MSCTAETLADRIMRFLGRPISSARAADNSAACTMASRVIERTPIGADADGLAVLQRHLDDVGELAVALVLEADIAGIDAVFVERLGAGGMLRQQLVPNVVKIADQRR